MNMYLTLFARQIKKYVTILESKVFTVRRKLNRFDTT